MTINIKLNPKTVCIIFKLISIFENPNITPDTNKQVAKKTAINDELFI